MRMHIQATGSVLPFGLRRAREGVLLTRAASSTGLARCCFCSGCWWSLSQSLVDGARLSQAMKEEDVAFWGRVLETLSRVRRVVKAKRRMVKRKATGPQELLWQRPTYPSLLATPCPPGLWQSRYLSSAQTPLQGKRRGVHIWTQS